MSSFYALLSRLGHIQRWSLMRNREPENVLEHSYMVALLAHALAVVRRDVLGLPGDPEKAATAALFHDATEVFTGDMPTPVKYFNSDIRAAYRRVEDAATERLLSLLPDTLTESYRPYLEADRHSETGALIHAADTLSAYLKCVGERRAGNSEFALAERQTKEKLQAMKRPEVDWFLAHCAPAFGQALDEWEGS